MGIMLDVFISLPNALCLFHVVNIWLLGQLMKIYDSVWFFVMLENDNLSENSLSDQEK